MSIDTRFEKARIIGARALQISMGAKPKVSVKELNSIDPIDIALEELKESENKKKKIEFPLDVKKNE